MRSLIYLPENLDLSEIILAELRESDIHFDLKSKEASTATQKPKYKIYCSQYLNIYFFFVLTRYKATCKKTYRVCIIQNDLENKKPQLLNEAQSYVDASKLVFHEKDELAEKINDSDNRFEFAARLCASKFGQLLQLSKKAQERPWQFDPVQVKTIDDALSALTDNIVADLELN